MKYSVQFKPDVSREVFVERFRSINAVIMYLIDYRNVYLVKDQDDGRFYLVDALSHLNLTDHDDDNLCIIESEEKFFDIELMEMKAKIKSGHHYYHFCNRIRGQHCNIDFLDNYYGCEVDVKVENDTYYLERGKSYGVTISREEFETWFNVVGE
ncbi:hypothetical protein 44RRORF005c [Aeromonas phage 44RR2.8t]|uniref:Uncharacterized protein n=2 Tax=Biquartavirus 44RR2 TaxID=115987 RepID=Q6U9U7_9CAUD|nr:hypothetical protein ST44RRORF005c [Aeromonas phage 44RR2.8t]AAQ81324.1 hypothetical protein 44RRORF005c [Aeromonas phage 44RR2.8t]APU00477.1 hypothetical protein [Aeromonas phage 44RR2.8t.2]